MYQQAIGCQTNLPGMHLLTWCPVLQVQPARFEQKGEAYVPKAKLTKKEKKALAAQQERLLSWGGCDDKLLAEQVCGGGEWGAPTAYSA
jgi:hypothetical protein